MNKLCKKILEQFEQGDIGFTDMEIYAASVDLDPGAYTEEEADAIYTAYTLFESPVVLARRMSNQCND
jgi:hypothetical protein